MATPRINVTKVKVHGAWRYRVNYREGKKRMRPTFESRAAANAEAARVRNDFSQLGSSWINLPPSDRSRLMDAWVKAKNSGLDLATLISHAPKPSISKKLSEVVAELVTAKKSAGRDDGYLNSLKIVLNQFLKGRESLAIDRVTLSNVEAFLDSKSLAYRSTLRARLSTLFNFSIRRRYITNNPCAQLEAVTYHKPPPQIFTPLQLKTALDWLQKNPNGMTWFVLTTLCGLRPEEAQKTPQNKIQTDAGIVIVDTQTTKVRERRVVTPMKEAIHWLNLSFKLGSYTPISKQSKKRFLKQLRKVLGFEKWPKDITRHTAASIWLARIKSAAEVAEQLGNSERVLKRDYKALVTPEMLREFMGVIQSQPLIFVHKTTP